MDIFDDSSTSKTWQFFNYKKIGNRCPRWSVYLPTEWRAWQNTSHILLSEHQLWFNLNKIKNWDKVNLSIGTEVEFSNNFVGRGFYVVPTLAAKWTF